MSELIEPVGSPFDDERLQFYLRHRDLIREWAALEQEVRAVTHGLMLELNGQLAEVTESLGPDVVLLPEALDSTWPRYALRRKSWPVSGGQSLVAVSLEWTQRIDPAGTETPYVGVRVHISNAEAKAIDQPLREAFAGSVDLPTRGYKLKGYPWWPALRRLAKNPDWWLDVPAWRQSVLDAHTEAWKLTAATIDRVLMETARQT